MQKDKIVLLSSAEPSPLWEQCPALYQYHLHNCHDILLQDQLSLKDIQNCIPSRRSHTLYNTWLALAVLLNYLLIIIIVIPATSKNGTQDIVLLSKRERHLDSCGHAREREVERLESPSSGGASFGNLGGPNSKKINKLKA
jgi:hypothetical protein